MDRRYADTVRLLLSVAPIVFEEPAFAMKGGTALNLFLHDLPRLSVDIDVVFVPWQAPRADALAAIAKGLDTIAAKLEQRGWAPAPWPATRASPSCWWRIRVTRSRSR